MRTIPELGVLVIAELTKPSHCDARGEPRTSLFVMGTLYTDSGSSPVKVRDLSPGGALIEGGVIPLPGTNVRLCRGSLNITGKIVWCRGGRAGLRFESRLSVAEWLPGGQAIAPQQRVDEVVQQVKASGMPALAIGPRPTLQSEKLSAVELTRLRVAIESLADDLATDPDVVKRHMAKLQTLDLVAQALRKLALER